MKNSVSFTLSVAILCIVVGGLIWYLFHMKPGTSPTRPANLPTAAVWKGNFDGGFWVTLVNTDTVAKTCRFKLYDEHKGTLAFDANFKPDSGCVMSVKDDLLSRIDEFHSDGDHSDGESENISSRSTTAVIWWPFCRRWEEVCGK